VNGSRILVVDDEGLIRWSLKEGLSEAGYAVTEAETGRSAIQRCREGVDLVVLDYRLPDIDGLEVARAIRKDRPSCPVILMTAYGSLELRQQAAEQQIREVVDKPFDIAELIELVGRALGRPPSGAPHSLHRLDR